MRLVETWEEDGNNFYAFSDGVFRSIKSGPGKIDYPFGKSVLRWQYMVAREAERDLEWLRQNVAHCAPQQQ